VQAKFMLELNRALSKSPQAVQSLPDQKAACTHISQRWTRESPLYGCAQTS
jgi:hypothetical protein